MSGNIPFYTKCNSCDNNNNNVCSKFKIQITPNDYCSWHSWNKSKCIFCNTTENILLAQFNDETYPLCQGHYNALMSCQGCINSQHCDFAADHSEPQIVTKVIQQGNMRMQVQQKNPNLLDKHCKICKCGYNDGSQIICRKEHPEYECQNWQLQKDLLQLHSQTPQE